MILDLELEVQSEVILNMIVVALVTNGSSLTTEIQKLSGLLKTKISKVAFGNKDNTKERKSNTRFY